jgi:hypothetical protein
VLRWLTVRICEECSFDWDLAIDGVLRTLASFPDGYRTRVDRFRCAPDAGLIRRRPSPEVWSALEYAAHVRDVIDFYADRIDRVLNEERPQMTGADFSSMSERRGYLEEDPAVVVDEIAGSSVVVEERLRSLSADQWARVGIGMDGDERTLLVLARRLAHDGQHHLLDLDRLDATLLCP